MAVITDELVRDEVRGWLADNWDPEITLAEWWERLCESGWAVPTWPEQWFGKGLPRELAGIVSEELRAAGAIGPPSGLGVLLAGPTILTHGDDAQRERYLRPILNGQEAWCQLFSEPGAGSDLASLQCRAERDGDEWIVNGQKVWTSGGQTADLGMLVARTDPDAPKHKGISYFAIEMDQPGVEVRPLREMTGRSLFSEVFFSDARVNQSAMIGELNGGWAVANTTLANERAGLGSGGSGAVGGAMPGKKANQLERRVGDLTAGRGRDRAERAVAGRQSNLLEKLAKDVGRDQDPNIRQRLAELHILNEVGRFTSLRVKAAKASGRGPRSRRQHGEAAHEPHHASVTRSRSRDPRAVRDAHGPRDSGRGSGARARAVRAGGVDLRRQRRGAEEHHRRARPRAAQGAGRRPRQDDALPRAQGRDATRRELTARRE